MHEIITVNATNIGDYQIIDPDTDDAKLIDLWCNRSRRSGSKNTSTTYCRIALQFMDYVGIPLQAVNYAHLEQWAQGLTGAINTRRLKVNAIRSLFSFAQALGYIRINPAKLLEPPAKEETKHRKILSEEEIIRLVSSDISPRDQAILRVMYSSGCRVSELINLRWRDVIPQGKKAVLVIRGKGDKTRESGISESAYAAMLGERKDGAAPTDFVFVTNRGGKIGRTTINYMFTRLGERLGKHISPHWFRHSHVSHALSRGANPVDVQEQVGHSSLEVTTGYAHKTRSSSDYLVI